MKKTKIIKTDEVKGGWQAKSQAKERWIRGKWRVGGVVKTDLSLTNYSKNIQTCKVVAEYPRFYVVNNGNYNICVSK